MAINFREILEKLTPVKSGMDIYEVVTASRMQAIQDAIAALARGDNVKAGANVNFRRGPDWIQMHAGKPGTSSTGEPPIPLEPVNASSGGVPKVKITWGTIGGLVPTIGGLPIGDTNPLTITAATVAIYAAIAVDNATGLPTSATIQSGTSMTLPANTSTLAHILIGGVEVSGGANPSAKVTRNLSGSQSYLRCRDWFSNPATYTHVFEVI